jgi:hypothetical protein
MCKRVHVEEYSNILMFLTHLSKDAFILFEILNQAGEIFKEFEPAKLENDIESLNKLAIEMPRLVYKDMEVKKHREDKLIAMDEMVQSQKEASADRETAIEEERKRKTLPTETMDLMSKLNVAYKTVEILGQILKNYYGSIKATEKYFLAEEAYKLGLRTLKAFITFVTVNVDGLNEKIQRHIEQQGNTANRDEILNKVGKLLFSLSCAISYTLIKKVSDSVGSENLYDTFEDVSYKNPFMSVKLIEMSIKLDQSRSLSYNDVRDLKDATEGNVLARSLLGLLVIDHFYMFDTNYQTKQRICGLLGISMDQVRAIDIKSTQKKNR